MRFHSYLNSAIQILAQYRGEEPCLSGRQAFASFIKKYFAQHKKYGSADRKQVSHLCFCYFRLGKAAMNLPTEERILLGLFLCSVVQNEILEQLKPEWNKKVKLSVTEKLSSIHYHLSSENVFPWKDELSEGIVHENFCKSFFIQPDLFLRLRPGKEKIVEEKLTAANICYAKLNDTCLALPNASKIDTVIELDKETIVQDYSSQQTGKFIRSEIPNPGSKINLWDCCAASGGKSIMLYDLYPAIELTVSDVRESILANLKKRFAKAGIAKYLSVVLDLSKNNIQYSIFNSQFSIILADVPCSGSGTWSRTPEQLYYFDEKKIDEYASLQRTIISNVIPRLKGGGYLLYITCSVFKKENEDIIAFIKQKFQLELIGMEVLKGYDIKADSMFTALLRKPL